MTQRLHERLVGKAEVLVTGPEQYDAALPVGGEGDLGGQPRLADTGFSGHERQLAVALLCRFPGPLESFLLPSSSDEGDGTRRRQPRRERDLRTGRLPTDPVDRHRVG
jgi:hypothetical protein